MLQTSYFGVAIGFASSICFAGNRSLASKPLVKSDPAVPTYIGLIVGVVIAAAAMLATGETASLGSATLIVVGIFVIVGIVHFAVGRQLSFAAVKNIGANLTSSLIATQVVYSVLLSAILLNESVNTAIILGTGLILLGAFLLETRSSAMKRGGSARSGYVLALVTGGIFGVTPILIKAGLTSFDFFASTTFIAFAAAMIFYAIAIPPKRVRAGIKILPKYALVSYIVAGIFGVSAQVTRFAALSIAPVVIIAPILSVHPIFTVLLTRKFARDFEIFHARTIAAIVITVVGAILVSISAGISI